jgi:hypothetical protein
MRPLPKGELNKKTALAAEVTAKTDITLDCFLYNNQGLYLFYLDI